MSPIHSLHQFQLRIFHWVSPNVKQLILDKFIDLTALAYLGTLEGSSLPRNAFIFELADGLYAERTVTQASLQQTRLLSDIVSGSSANIYPSRSHPHHEHVSQPVNDATGDQESSGDKSAGAAKGDRASSRPNGRRDASLETYSLSQLQDLITAHQQLRRRVMGMQELADTVKLRIEEQRPILEQQRARDMLRRRVRQQKTEALRRSRELLQKESLQLERLKQEVLPQARALKQAQIALIANKQQLAERKQLLERDHQLFLLRCEALAIRRRTLISQLRSIYPIAPLGDKTLSIAGFSLPNSDFTGCDEENVATALGYVCHALFMISKWLQVPLRYTMIPMCSRSFIRDDIAQETSPKFPLYSRGMDRPRFEYAVFLLNKNLEQLMSFQGLDIISLRQTLPNLQRLYQVADPESSSAQHSKYPPASPSSTHSPSFHR